MPPDSSEAPRPVGAADAPSREEPPSRNEDGSAGESTQRKRSASDERLEGASAGDPPLPYDEEPPPLPEEAPPEDDGWTYQWDDNAGAYYFYNRLTGKSQWENPRISEAAPTSYGSYDRFANNLSPSLSPSYPNPCPLQIRPYSQCWRSRYLVAA